MLWFSVKIGDAFIKATQKIRTREEGASAIEYSLLIALIAAILVVAVKNLGLKVLGCFDQVETTMP